ncbi:MAG: CPBP family intramembrane glutamic endopeptidase [Bacillota bacterium]
MNNRITVTGANKVFLVVTVLCFIFSIVIGIVDVFFSGLIDNNTYLMLIINQFYFILFPVLFYLIKNKIDIKEVLRFNKLDLLPAFLIILISLPAYLGALSLNVIALYVIQFTGYTPDSSMPTPENLGELLVVVLVVAVSPAICEEILHRGVLLKAYERRGSVKAVVISSILFGIFHYDITNLAAPVFLGLLIGYYVVRTNSIFAGMLAHFLNNFISVLFQYFMSKSDSVSESARVTEEQLVAMIIFGIVCMAAVFFLVICFHFGTKGKYTLRPSGTTLLNDVVSIVTHWPVAIALLLYILFTLIILSG